MWLEYNNYENQMKSLEFQSNHMGALSSSKLLKYYDALKLF